MRDEIRRSVIRTWNRGAYVYAELACGHTRRVAAGIAVTDFVDCATCRNQLETIQAPAERAR